MSRSSPGSVAAAPVHPGRAPRRVPPPAFRRTRWVLLVAALAVLGGLAPAAQAHEASDPEIAAILDQVSPEMPGVDLTVETTRLGSQFVLENSTDTEVTILSSVGDPLFRIGPEGVLGNFRSPEWYTSKVPAEAVTIPERAQERGTPVWARVSEDPAWGWFDHRLHAVVLSDEQKDDAAPLTNFGSWTVPLEYGDTLGSVDGHYEYRPALGEFTPSLSQDSPAAGVTLAALAGNPTVGISVANTGDREVVVLGDEDEPFLRLTPNGTEANALSRTWIASQDPSLVAGSGADASAPPQWAPVNVSPQYPFLLERADPTLPLAELYALDRPTVVSEWTVSLIVDGRRIDVPGETTMTPATWTGTPTWVWIVAGTGGAAGIGALGWFLVRRRGSGKISRGEARAETERERAETGAAV